MITSSGDYSRFIDNPKKYPNEAFIYNQFFSQNKLIKEFINDGETMSGPVIRVYKINH